MLFRRKPFGGGGDPEFLAFAYRALLGRPPDPGGQAHYLERLRSGEMGREEVVADIVDSEEFRLRRGIKYDVTEALFDEVEVFPAAPFARRVRPRPLEGAQLCELVNPRKWLDPSWRSFQRQLAVVPMDLGRMHRKTFEWTQAMYGLDRLGALGPGRRCLGVGAGHEPLAYWLANRAAEVVATDLYEGDWASRESREGDPAVLADARRFAPFPYAEDRLTFRRMDGRELEFPDGSFDVVFSLSSIEHFGGHAGAARAMREIGRVLRPGGVAAIATELVLNDAGHGEFFRPAELLEHVVDASGLLLVQPPVFRMPRHALEHPCVMPRERHLTPHIVLREGSVLYTSVLLFLSAPEPGRRP